jgi:hypothetical protein
MVMPHLYKKLKELMNDCDRVDRQNEARRNEMRKILAQRFRLDKRDIGIALREMEGKQVKRINQRKIRIRP